MTKTPGRAQSRWVPLVGPEYAVVAGRGLRWMWIGIASVVGAVLVIFASDSLTAGRLGAWGPFLQFLVYCAGAAVLVYGLTQYIRASLKIVRDLRERGIQAAHAPDLRGPNSFMRWCATEQITPAQIIETGRLKYGGTA